MIFKCVSCQHEHHQQPGYWVPPSQCEKCGGGVTMVRDTERPPAASSGEPLSHDEIKSAMEGFVSGKGKGPRVFMSTMLYGLSRELGPADATAELGRQVKELGETGPVQRDEYLPVASLITRALGLFDVALLVDAGASNIAKARCRAAHQFLKSDRDIWIMVDDDVDASSLALQALVEAVDGGAPSVCVAPCLFRRWTKGEDALPPLANVAFEQVVVDRELPSGGKVRTVLFGGFGLVAISREALHRVAQLSLPQFVDDDGETKIAFFDDLFEPHSPDVQRKEGEPLLYDWYGEDVAFFQMLPQSVRAEALLVGHTRHAGELLDVSQPYTPMPVRPSFTRRTVAAKTEQKVVKPIESGELAIQAPASAMDAAQAELLAKHAAALASEKLPPAGAAEGQAEQQQQTKPAAEL